jgi:hypothetical protein
VEFGDRVDGENLYRRVDFSADVVLSDEQREDLRQASGGTHGDEPVGTIAGVHAFGGGVTIDWLIERITGWDEVLREQQRVARNAARRGHRSRSRAEATVH